jgi:hypothetical protein
MGNPLSKLDIETTSTGQKPIATTTLTFRNRITVPLHSTDECDYTQFPIPQ